jgi:hypothetical protein
MPKLNFPAYCRACLVVLGAVASAPACAQEMAPMLHNGSLMLWTRQPDGRVQIAYETPKAGLPVSRGTVLFKGVSNAKGGYSGTAFVFSRNCPPQPYPVTGDAAGPGIILSGVAPLRDPACRPIPGTSNRSASRLVFAFEPD